MGLNIQIRNERRRKVRTPYIRLSCIDALNLTEACGWRASDLEGGPPLAFERNFLKHFNRRTSALRLRREPQAVRLVRWSLNLSPWGAPRGTPNELREACLRASLLIRRNQDRSPRSDGKTGLVALA